MFLLKFSLTLIRAFQKLRFCQSRQFLSYAWRRLFASATPSAFMQAQASVCHPLRPLSRAPEIINVEIFGIVLLFSYQSPLLLIWSSLSILSNRKKFVNNFFHLFSNFFLIWWNLCCFALFSLTAWLWYHSYFELSTVFLIFSIKYFIAAYKAHSGTLIVQCMILYLNVKIQY